jgi:hypothetical protein
MGYAQPVSDQLPEPWSDPGSELDLAAASVRSGGADVQAMIDALASRLEEALPGGAEVRRRRVGGFRSKRTEVERIVVDVGDESFELSRSGGAIVCLRNKVVRGITLKRVEVPIESWVRELVEAVSASAAIGERARAVLESLVL